MMQKIKNAGFHVHVYFDADTRTQALFLYRAIEETFKNAHPDVFLGHIHNRPIGPHTKPMFHISVEPHMFEPVVTWLMFNRNGLSVLVHPLSGNELADHTHNMLWLGTPVPLDIKKL